MPSGYAPVSPSIAAALSEWRTAMGVSSDPIGGEGAALYPADRPMPRSKKPALVKKARTQPSFIFLGEELASFFEVLFGEKWAEDLDAQFYYMVQAKGYKYERQMKEAFDKIEDKLKAKGS